MPTYHNKGNYLLVEVNEPFELGLFQSVIHQVADWCIREGVYKVIVDTRAAEGDLTITDRYILGNQIADVWKFNIQGAGIARGEIINFVMENVAVNRGANVKGFSTMKDALHWLGVPSSAGEPGEQA